MNKIISYFKNLTSKEATKFLVIFYMVGICGFLVSHTRPFFEMLIPLSLLINAFLIALFHQPFNKKHMVFFVCVALFTITVEAIGVKTGLLFGEYFYGKSLGLKIAETPILIGINWLMLAYGAVAIIRSVPALRKALPVLGGGLMVLYDFVMEPVAIKTGMWFWAMNSIPLQNYIMWFIVAVLVVGSFDLFNIKTQSKLAARVFVAQLIFFLVLNLFLP